MAADTFDVVVIGGGVVGAGVALDAATRGLTVALIEARDFGSGTSSRSSKLIHGGLRYLEMLDFRLVREALKERSLLTRELAPHLVKPVSFLLPLQHHYERAYIGAGVALYDLLASLGGRRNHIPRHRHLSRKAALKKFPALRSDALKGAISYYDAQVDDSRFVVTVLRTACANGAVAVSRCEVQRVVRANGVSEITVADRENDNTFAVKARNVVNATGVWSNDIDGIDSGDSHRVRASKGVHIVVPKSCVPGDGGLITRTEKSVMFVIPWGEYWIIGTTDTDWDHDKAHPSATKSDIEYILHEANSWFETALTHDDIHGVYVGLRPLVSQPESSTAKLSREHVVEKSADGVVSVRGGKYTTYRVMAKDAVDLISDVPSRTEVTPLLGAQDSDDPFSHRYGSLAPEVRALIADDPALADQVPGADGHIGAEFVYAASFEGALHLEDLLTRRTHLSIETKDRGVEAARPVADLVAPVLSWDQARVDHEVDAYVARVEAERRSQEADDDATADAVRTAAPDVV